MIEAGTEYVIASPFQNSSYGPVEKMGIPIIEGADYMEAHPLGRTEWIRFYGLLFDREELADSLFRATERRYLELKELAARVTDRPTVVSEKRFGSTWYVPAGESYIAHFFADAGADYLFSDLPGSGSTPMAFETVFDHAIHADLWLIKYNQTEDMTYNELRREYTPYENFDAFKNRNIFGCNTGRVPYYEESPIHPDYLLEDLIFIFHPELLPGYTPRYYMPFGLGKATNHPDKVENLYP
jgi:iron complex transport system substrate-binding protein